MDFPFHNSPGEELLLLKKFVWGFSSQKTCILRDVVKVVGNIEGALVHPDCSSCCFFSLLWWLLPA